MAKIVIGTNARVKINGVEVGYAISFSPFEEIWGLKLAVKCATMNTRLCGGRKVGGIKATEDLCRLLWKLNLKL
jgi:hypothetical protein